LPVLRAISNQMESSDNSEIAVEYKSRATFLCCTAQYG
jgi:hypothetical protein